MKLLGAIEIAALDAVEIAVEPWTWPFAQARRADIDRHFAARQRERPALWNGRTLLLHRYARENGVLRGASFETDYASYLAWRDWGRPAVGVVNVVAAAALQSADGAFLFGQMAPFTAAAGRWVFPGGMPDPNDITSAGTILPTTWVANCLRRLALILALAKSIRAGRRCATAGSSP